MLSAGLPLVPKLSWFSETLISSPLSDPARHSIAHPTHADSRFSQRTNKPTHITALPAYAPKPTSPLSGG